MLNFVLTDEEKCDGGARGETTGEMEEILGKDGVSEEDHQGQRVWWQEDESCSLEQVTSHIQIHRPSQVNCFLFRVDEVAVSRSALPTESSEKPSKTQTLSLWRMLWTAGARKTGRSEASEKGNLRRKRCFRSHSYTQGIYRRPRTTAPDASASLAGTEGEKAAAFAERLGRAENSDCLPLRTSPIRGAVQSRGFKMQVETLPLKSRVKFSSTFVRPRLEFSPHWGRGSQNTMGFCWKCRSENKPVVEGDSPGAMLQPWLSK